MSVISEPLDAAPTDAVQSANVSPPPNASLPRTPTIPTNSYLSEVTVENRDEGSSSESSDDMSEGGIEHQTYRRQKTPDEQHLSSNDDLEAVVRGPASKRQSILHILDRFTGDEDDKDSDSGEEEAELEEDVDEETGRSGHQPFRGIMRSSDSESEDEESRSPSPSRAVEYASNNIPSVQGSTKTTEESAEHQETDVIMRDVVDPPVLEGQDDNSSEETHVGSEDHMVVDQSSEGKGAPAAAEEQPSSPDPKASILQPLDAPGNEPQEPAETEVETAPAPNQYGSAPIASEVLNEAEADPIEPADDLAAPTVSGLSNVDPIESPSENIVTSNMTQLTPKPGVSRRIKTRSGQILDDVADHPVLLEQLASEATAEVTPMPTKGKSRRKVTETTASQERSTRKSPRFSSLPTSTSTPAVVALLNHRFKFGARTGKAAKISAKRSEECSNDTSKGSIKEDATQNGACIAPTPSLIGWETLAEPSSPSPQLDESLVLIDELMSSSPRPDDIAVRERLNDKEKKGRPRKHATSSRAGSSQGEERLFDLSSSQIPFPYSQHQTKPATASPNGNESEGTTDSEDEPRVPKKRAKLHVRYRSLSQLASQATLFSPSLPTPANKSVTNGKAKKRAVEVDSSSSSSSSSDGDEANGSEHIPRERRAGSVLERKKRKSLLSRI